MSKPDVTLSVSYDKDTPDRTAIFTGVRQDAQSRALPHWPQAQQQGWVTITVTDKEGRIVGGCFGDSFLAHMHVAVIWVDKKYQGRGLGRKLLESIQEEARDAGCTTVSLETLSFQAPKFYEKFGFQEFARLQFFPQGPERIFFSKQL